MKAQGKIAAIRCRVSTHDQRELSPDTQETLVRRALETQGYEIPAEYVLNVDWTSLDGSLVRISSGYGSGYQNDASRLSACWIVTGFRRRGSSDSCSWRSAASMTSRLSPFRRHRLLKATRGSSWSSRWLLARSGRLSARKKALGQGSGGRAELRRLPAVPRPFFGYSWNGTQFVPNERYPVVEGIWRMLLDGRTDRGIAAILTKAAVSAPGGDQGWNSRAIARVATNPAYCGNYTALRHEAVLPKTRKGQTYGKTSTRPRFTGAQVVLPDLVERASVTPEEFDAVQVRRAQNKALGGRRFHEYLLRGMVFCDIDGNHFTGTTQRSHRASYAYRCTGRNREAGRPRCRSRVLPGPTLEQAVWDAVKGFLEQPELFLTEVEGYGASQQHSAETIREAMGRLDRQMAQYAFFRQRAYDEYVREMTDEETYRRVIAGYRAHETWLKDELERQGRELAAAERQALNAATVHTASMTCSRRGWSKLRALTSASS